MKTLNKLGKLSIYVLGGFFLLILLIEAILYFAGGPLSRWVVDRFNSAQPGEAYVEDLHISILSGFPSICLSLDEFSYYERPVDSRSAGELPILKVNQLEAGLNPWSLIRSQVRVTKLSLDSGYVGLIIYPDSSINLLNALGPLAEMAPEEEEEVEEDTTETGQFEFVLKDLDIRNLNARIDDEPGDRGIDFLLERMKHRFAYRKKEIKNKLNLEGRVRDLWRGADTLLSGYPLSLSAEFEFDRQNYFADIRRCELSAGGIELSGAGEYDHFNEGMADLEVAAEMTNLDLRPLLTLGVLDSNFFTDHIYGAVKLNGSLKGRIRSKEIPLIETEFSIDTLHFRDRMGLPLVDRLNAAGYFTTGEIPDLSKASLRLDELDLKLPDGYTKGNLFVENFVDPRFEFNLEIDHELAAVERFMSISPASGLTGKFRADIDLKGSYDRDQPFGLNMETASGIFEAKGIRFVVPEQNLDFHRVDAGLSFQDDRIALDTLGVKVNNSDLGMRGSINNFLSYFFGQPVDLTGNLTLEAEKIVWADIITDPFLLNILDRSISNFYCELYLTGEGAGRIKGRILPTGNLEFKRLHLERSESPDIRRIRGSVGIQPDALGIKDLIGIVGESDFSLSAGIRNYHAFIDRSISQDIKLVFDVNSNTMRAKDFLVVNGRFLAPEQFLEEKLDNFRFIGNYSFNNQELNKQRQVPNSAFQISNLDFNFSLFPASVVQVKMLMFLRENSLVLESFSGAIGESDLNISASIDRVAGSRQERSALTDFRYNMNVRSSYLNFDELLAINLAEKENAAPEETIPTPELTDVDNKEAIIEERLSGYNLFANDFPEATFTLSIDSLRIFSRRLEGIAGKLTVRPEKTITLEEFLIGLGAGSVLFSGSIDASDPNLLLLNTKNSFENADLSSISVPFVYDSVSYVISEHFAGTMDGAMDLTIGMTPQLEFDLGDVFGTIDFSLREGQIRDFAPLLILGDFLGDRDLTFVRIDDIENTLVLEDSILTLPLMDINSTMGHLRMAGFQNVNGEMEYLMQLPLGLVSEAAWNYLTGKERKEDAAEDEIERGDDSTIYISIRIEGTPDDYKIRLGKGKSFREMVREARQERREKRRAEKKMGPSQ